MEISIVGRAESFITQPKICSLSQHRIAVLLPCYNEEAAITATVKGFRAALPEATIYVYDNNSQDQTKALALAAGAIVRHEQKQGKGEVVRRMFSDIEADIYVLADGDGTYDASAAPAMIRQLLDGQYDMVAGVRNSEHEAAYRRGHRFGNLMLTFILTQMFGQSFSDILTGYRVFSRRFVKTFPVLSRGFEIETEISIHALELSMPVAEVKTRYGARPEGSASKLSTYRDGLRILRTMIALYRSERPLVFFGFAGIVLAVFSILLAIPVFYEYLHTGLVPRLPTAILATGMMTISVLCFFSGLILDTVTRGRREMKRIGYLGQPALSGQGQQQTSRNDS